MSQERKKFTIKRWFGVGVPLVLLAALGAVAWNESVKREKELHEYLVKANACAAGLEKAMSAIKAMGYGGYPDAVQGTPEYDLHYAYYRRFSELERVRSSLLTEHDPEFFSFRLDDEECRTVAANKDVRFEPLVIEKSAPRPLTYEESVAKAWEDADRANAQVDKAMEDMLEGYRKKAVSAKTVPSSGSRVDLFEMPDGTIVTCRTSFRNGARATSCS